MGSQGLARPIVSICNNYGAKPGLTVTDQDNPSAPWLISQSVTAAGRFFVQMLQIKTNQSVRRQHLDL